jgi:hypothetical protein
MIRRNGRYDGYVLMHNDTQLSIGINTNGERQNLTLPTITTTTAFNMYEDEDSEENAAVVEKRASKNDARLALLLSSGIMEPTASRLLEKQWITKEYIEAHIDKANREKTPVGLLIHRMRSHDPIPKDYYDGSPESYRKSWLGDRDIERSIRETEEYRKNWKLDQE